MKNKTPLKRIYKALILTLLICWELPQNILGIIILLVMKLKNNVSYIHFTHNCIFICTHKTGISLGRFVFWTPSGNRFKHYENDCKMHEYGHSIQSIIFGPLYLIIIGLPSTLRYIYSKWIYKKRGIYWDKYYNGFPENWADKLGGVNIKF